MISIHAPRGGSDTKFPYTVACRFNFNPRSPWGERPLVGQEMTASFLFQSTLPVGGATFYDIINAVFDIYFNPRSPWGERRIVLPLGLA